MRRLLVLVTLALVSLPLATPAANAGSTSGTFQLLAGGDFGRAANGDEVMITGEGTFSVDPMSVTASGAFTHFDADGNVRAGGTWTATRMLSLNFYGCRYIPALGVDLGDDNLCGGALKLAVVLDTPLGELPGILTVFCIVGPNAPAAHSTEEGEGVTLNVPGVINFSHTAEGDNIYIRTS
jgi:hypothetical protein